MVVMVIIKESEQFFTGTVPKPLITTTSIHNHDGVIDLSKVLGKPFQLGRTTFCTSRNPYSALDVCTFLLERSSFSLTKGISGFELIVV